VKKIKKNKTNDTSNRSLGKFCSGNLKELCHLLGLSLQEKFAEVSNRNTIVRDDWIY
jgi:hypothetical protein